MTEQHQAELRQRVAELEAENARLRAAVEALRNEHCQVHELLKEECKRC